MAALGDLESLGDKAMPAAARWSVFLGVSVHLVVLRYVWLREKEEVTGQQDVRLELCSLAPWASAAERTVSRGGWSEPCHSYCALEISGQ